MIVGSRYGTDSHPAWTYNLEAEPQATALIRGERHAVTARRMAPAELDALWPQLIELYPAWQDYRERTDRVFRAYHLTVR